MVVARLRRDGKKTERSFERSGGEVELRRSLWFSSRRAGWDDTDPA